jgi:hypothetical protein
MFNRAFLLRRGAQERGVEGKPGVVDDEVERSVSVGDPGGDKLAAVLRAEIGRQHLCRDAMHRPQLVSAPREPIHVPSDQHQVVSVLGQLAGERGADARGGAGNEGGGHGNLTWSVPLQPAPSAR